MKLFFIIFLIIFVLIAFFILKFASSFLRTLNAISYNLRDKKQKKHYGNLIYDKDNIKIYKGNAQDNKDKEDL